jgi:DNA gyrase subunit B
VAAYDPDADIVARLRELSLSQDLLFPDAVVFSEQADDLSVEIALQWTNGVTEQIHSYANDNPTTQGGMHVEGFSKALTDGVKAHAGSADSTSVSLLGGDIREGLRAIIRTHCDDPSFEPIHDDGSNGRKLSTVRIREFVYWATSTHLSSWLDDHPTEATLIVHKSISAAHDRVLARAQSEDREAG